MRQVVRDRNEQGDGRVRHWNHSDPALDRLGCDWYFSARDHRLIAAKLDDHLYGLSPGW
ncbi:MAG: hypothetical protein QOF58_7576 [Pseudonocardiales bacterium]|nr:hypothetical protein [Pseudonocardiales bacterium]